MDKERDEKSRPERIIPEKEHHPEEERRERGKGKDLEQGSEQIDDQANIRKREGSEDLSKGYGRMKDEGKDAGSAEDKTGNGNMRKETK